MPISRRCGKEKSFVLSVLNTGNFEAVLLTHNKETFMAQGTHGKAGAQWQKQANHFQALITSAQAVVDDPASTDEEKADAQQTITDMQKNLQRLSDKYGVAPAA